LSSEALTLRSLSSARHMFFDAFSTTQFRGQMQMRFVQLKVSYLLAIDFT
jgi:hypothetical protein